MPELLRGRCPHSLRSPRRPQAGCALPWDLLAHPGGQTRPQSIEHATRDDVTLGSHRAHAAQRSGEAANVSERWYKEAVIYSVEVESFQDSDADGFGDLRGLMSRLDYLSRLGVTCLWLNPIHPTPHRDDGYDVPDYYAV